MVAKIPCFREAGNTMENKEYDFYSLSSVDKPAGSIYIDLDYAWRCGEYDEDDIALCKRCAKALGVLW